MKKSLKKIEINSWFQKSKKMLKSSQLKMVNVLFTVVTLIARHTLAIKNHAAGIVILGTISNATKCQVFLVGGTELVISAPIPTNTM